MTINLVNVDNFTDGFQAELNGAYYSESVTIDETTFVIVAAYVDDGLSVFSIDDAGQVNNVFNISDSTLDNTELGLQGPAGLAVTEIGGINYLYVAGFDDDALQVFSIGNTGILTPVQVVENDDDILLNAPHFVEIVEVGGNKFLYSTAYSEFGLDDGVAVFSIGNDGMLTNIQNVPDETSSLFDPMVDQPAEIEGPATLSQAVVNGVTYLFVAGFDDDGFATYSVGNDGLLTLVQNVQDDDDVFLDGPHSLKTAVVGDTTYLLVAGLLDDGLSVYEIDDAGLATNVFNLPDNGTLNLNGAARLDTAVLGTTTYVFAPGFNDNGISAFVLNADGSLTNVDNVQESDDPSDLELREVFSAQVVTLGSQPFIVATGFQDDGISIFRLDNEPIEILEDGPFDVDENSPNGTAVGDVDARLGDGGATDENIGYAIVGGNDGIDGDDDPAFSIDPDTGAITVNDPGDLNFEVQDSYDLTVQVTDQQIGVTQTVTVTVTINDVNDAPTVDIPDGLSVEQDNPLSLADVVVDDEDGDTVTVMLSGAPNSSFTGVISVPVTVDGLSTAAITISGSVDDVNTALDELSFNPPAGFAGSTDLTATISDPEDATGTDTASVTVTGDGISTVPVFDPFGNPTIPENTPEDTEVEDADASIAGGPADEDITYKIINGNVDVDQDGNEPFAIDPDTGEITVNDSGDLDFEQMDVFVLTICATNENTDETSTATVTITLTDENEPPIFTPNNGLATPEDTGIALTGFMVEDDDNDILTVTLNSLDSTFNGPVNAPVTANGLGTATLTLIGLPDDIETALGEITFVPPVDFNGDQLVTFVVSDGNGGSDDGTFDITVFAESDPPNITNVDSETIPENSPEGTDSGNVDATVNDGPIDENITYKIIDGNVDVDQDGNEPFVIDPDTGEITVNDSGDLDFEQMDVFVLTICATNDLTNETSTTTVTITLTDENDPPVIQGPNDLITPENTPVVLNGFIISDQDGDDLDVTVSDVGANFTGMVTAPVTVMGLGTDTITLSGQADDIVDALGEISYTPPLDFDGLATVFAMADDGNPDGTDTDNFAISVTDATNAAPVAQADVFFTTLLSGALSGNVLDDNGNGPDTDADGDELSVSLLAGPLNGDLELNEDGSFVYNPTGASFCADQFVYQLEDANGAVSTATVFITVGLDDPDLSNINPLDFDNVVTLTSGNDRYGNSRVLERDFVDGLGGDDKLKGRFGDDVMIGGDGDDNVHGGAGDDILLGNAGDDKMRGKDGDDTMSGGDGDDKVDGGDGDDSLFGGAGNDQIKAGDGDDIADGGTGNDNIKGRAGDDILFGNDGDDDLNGGNGEDIILGGAGSDLLTGGGDADTFVYNENDGSDIITDYDRGEDMIDFSCSDIGIESFEDLLAITTQIGKDVVFNFGGNDLLTLRNTDLEDLSADMFVF